MCRTCVLDTWSGSGLIGFVKRSERSDWLVSWALGLLAASDTECRCCDLVSKYLLCIVTLLLLVCVSVGMQAAKSYLAEAECTSAPPPLHFCIPNHSRQHFRLNLNMNHTAFEDTHTCKLQDLEITEIVESDSSCLNQYMRTRGLINLMKPVPWGFGISINTVLFVTLTYTCGRA